MAISPEFRDYVLEMLEPLGPGLNARRMFGGAGLYLSGTIFGLISEDVLYFRTDEGSRGDYEAAGTGPFVPFEDGRMTMPYHEVPAEVMEDAESLSAWARRAWEASRRAGAAKGARKPAGRRAEG